MHPLATILSALRAAIAAHAARDRARAALWLLTWGYLSRASRRLESLIASWRAGTLPKPRASATKTRAPRESLPRLPAGRAWLVTTIAGTASLASQFQHALSDTEIEAFLAAAPQAGRLLRPLCRMLGLRLAGEAPRPRRVRPPRPAPAIPPTPPRPLWRSSRPPPPMFPARLYPARRFSPA